MQAEIITIGDEILIGQIVDSNSAWMAKKLNLIGVKIHQIISISDNSEHIINTLKNSLLNSEIVFITGGLGPTNDDITKETLCKFFNTKLIFHQPSFEDIKKFVKSRNSVLNELNKKQAEIPENCMPIRNLNGTAPGMWFEQGNKIIISMPGVPYEMKAMMENIIIPELQKRYKLERIIHKTVLIPGIPEAILAEKIEQWEKHLPEYIKLAYLPSPGLIRLRLSIYTKQTEYSEKQIDDEIQKLNKILPNTIAGIDKENLESSIANLMISNKLTLATAESCTGGKIAQLITSIPGCSNYFLGAVISYANTVKIESLGVNNKSIESSGAVSKQVVEEMAKGVRKKLGSTFSIATSGIAGPTGGTAEKPVGTTWIAVSSSNRTISKKYIFTGERNQIIEKASRTALNLLRIEILYTMQTL
ncbi:MAG: competence/damage-inducible protein A [Chlorobi bacterium]|nr:competence/damage-inducible protein A [Chlorobiota bacterium]